MEVIVDNVSIDLDTMIISSSSYEDSVRFLKTKYDNNYERFKSRFLDIVSRDIEMYNNLQLSHSFFNLYHNLWNSVNKFSYEDAFNIKSNQLRALVFSVINVPEMIRHLGSTRIKTSGIDLTNKIYNEYKGEFIENEFTQIYELHSVKGEKIGLDETLYTIKCWCTSTNEEHWLWVDEESIPNMCPLEGIASTCRVYENMIGNIKHIIRQGDVFIFEMNKKVIPNSEVVSLDKDTYFKLLKSQS